MLWLTVAAGVFAAAREVEVRMSRPAADRRFWQLRGRRPHEFGRFRTVRSLVVPGPRPGRLVVGHIAHPSALVAVHDNVQIAVIAAQRTGKTSGIVTPAILEQLGPLVATSARHDIVHATIERRRELGQVFKWDPFGADSDAWDPLHGCENWGDALLVARWLGHAIALGRSEHRQYFDKEAESLVAPLLHAAALTDDTSIGDVYRWILDHKKQPPPAAVATLTAHQATDALKRLNAVYAYTERQRDGIIGTGKVQLDAYGHPAAARTAARGEGMTPESCSRPAPPTRCSWSPGPSTRSCSRRSWSP